MAQARAKSKKTSGKHPQSGHADHSGDHSRLNRVSGQINGIKRMVDEGEYCPNIIAQVRAARDALMAIEAQMLTRHVQHCVVDALHSKDAKFSQKKIDEMVKLITNARKKGSLR